MRQLQRVERWTLRQKRISFYLESPAYAKTVRSVEVFFKNMMEPMATSIEANIEVPFNVSSGHH